MLTRRVRRVFGNRFRRAVDIDGRHVCVHLTTCHPHDDNRVCVLQASELASAGYEVAVVSAIATTSGRLGEVSLVGLGLKASKLRRLTSTSFLAWRAALRLRPSAVQIHEPELLLGAPFARLLGVKVIYDAHESTRLLARDGVRVPKALRVPVGALASAWESLFVRTCSAFVAATPLIGTYHRHPSTVVVRNMPRVEHRPVRLPAPVNPRAVWCGPLTAIRCPDELEAAVRRVREVHPGFEMVVFGCGTTPSEYIDRMRDVIEFRDWTPHDMIMAEIAKSSFGVALYDYSPNHLDAIPTKVFEYLAMGKACVVSASVRLVPEMTNYSPAVIQVNPHDVDEIVQAMLGLCGSRERCELLGAEGLREFEESLNWGSEGRKVRQLYASMLGTSAPATDPVSE